MGLACILSSCVPEIKREITSIDLDTNTPLFREVTDYIVDEKIDSLSYLFNDRNANRRYLTARAFSSLETGLLTDSLVALLDDKVIAVRVEAAKSLGQLGANKGLSPLVSSFKTQDTTDVNNDFNRAILESVGKLGDEQYLELISSTKTYRKSDNLLLLGQARSIYQFMLRGITNEKATALMINNLTDNEISDDIRLVAAHYLSRAKDISLEDYKFRLAEIFTREENVLIRMELASILGKINDLQILSYLKNQFAIEKDYRVKLNIIKAYGNYPYIEVIDDIFELLKNRDTRIASAAADYMYTYGQPADALIYKTSLKDSLPPLVESKVYRAILNQLPHYYTNSRNQLRSDILERISMNDDTYIKAAYIESLGYDPMSYKVLEEMYEDENSSIVKTSITQALAAILKDQKTVYTYKAGIRGVRRNILTIYKNLLAQNDTGIAAVIGTSIADEKSGLKPLIDSTEFISKAISRLQIPRQIEAHQQLTKALSYVTEQDQNSNLQIKVKKVNWAALEAVSDSTVVVIKTNKGNISVELYPARAPESVANFINLINDNFYDEKIFHRVVPNFVIQTGCPRGDGYGGLDYVIHSELADAIYDDEGYLGMASAGRHTEGTQWFITHRPTPHLDMRYTIFGKVIKGMDVVHDIVQGDKIVDVIITK